MRKLCVLFFALSLTGCTVSNPLFVGDPDLATPGNGDLAGADLSNMSDPDFSLTDDLAQPPDLRKSDMRKPDLGTTPDDLGSGDLKPAGDMMVSDCGGPGQKCCAGSTCAGGGCCESNVCIASGQMCTLPFVASVCKGGTCTTCGITGTECCTNHSCTAGCCGATNTCVPVALSCGGSLGNCNLDGSCGSCGASGNICCAAAPINLCTASGTVCADGPTGAGQCKSCGGTSEPCCDGNACRDGGCCVSGTCRKNGDLCGNTLCVNGSCQGGACGGVGQGCCAGACTAPYTTCPPGGQQCVLCGGNNQRCCWDWRMDQYIWCSAPYHADSSAGSCLCKP